MDLAEYAYERWGGVCRALGEQPLCPCGATIDTYTDACRQQGRCPGFRKIEATVASMAASDPRPSVQHLTAEVK